MSQTDFTQKIKDFFIKAKAVLKKFFYKAWQYMKIAKIELIVLFGLLIFDLLTKFIVAKTMSLGESKTIIPNFFNLYYVHNKRAAFGQAFGLEKILGDNGVRIVFLIITTVALGIFSFFLYYFRGKHILARLSLALIISGALGNFYDRLFLGYVRDFAEIVFFGLDIPGLGETFAIFNIADVALVAGAIIFAIYFIFIYKTPKQEFVGPIYQPDYCATPDSKQNVINESDESDKNKECDKEALNG